MDLIKKNIKLNFFEKRFVIFSETRKVLEIIKDAESLDTGDYYKGLHDFRIKTMEASFIFGDDITAKLNKIFEVGKKKGLIMREYQNYYERKKNGGDVSIEEYDRIY